MLTIENIETTKEKLESCGASLLNSRVDSDGETVEFWLTKEGVTFEICSDGNVVFYGSSITVPGSIVEMLADRLKEIKGEF